MLWLGLFKKHSMWRVYTPVFPVIMILKQFLYQFLDRKTFVKITPKNFKGFIFEVQKQLYKTVMDI